MKPSLLLSLLIASLIPLAAAAAPRLTLSPTVGHPKNVVQIGGSGFGANEAVDLYFDTGDVLLAIANASGSLAKYKLEIPADALPGTHWITAIGRRDGIAGQKAFTVRTDWPQFGFGLQAHHYNPYENVVSTANVNRLGVVWSAQTGLVESSPAVSGGVVYAGGYYGNLYALDARTGAVKWMAPQCASIVNASPTVYKGVIYVGCESDNNLYAFNAGNGSLKWTAAAGAGFWSSPAVSGDTVYAGSIDGKLYARYAATGAPRWTATTGNTIDSSPAVANGAVYVGSDDSKLYAFGADDGAPLWSYATGGWIESSPVVANNTVYVGSDDHKLYALNAITGSLNWSFDAGSAVSTPAFANGTVYVGCWGGSTLYALNAGTGKMLWSATVGATLFGPSIANGVVYVATEDNKLHALYSYNGVELWNVANIGGAAPPVIADGILYAGSYTSQNDKLYALALDGGNNAAYRNGHTAPPSYASLHPDLHLKIPR